MSGIADEQALALEQTGGSMPDGVQEEYEFGRGRPGDQRVLSRRFANRERTIVYP